MSQIKTKLDVTDQDCARLLTYLRARYDIPASVHRLFQHLAEYSPQVRLLRNIRNGLQAMVAAGNAKHFDDRAILLGDELQAFAALVRYGVPEDLLEIASGLLDRYHRSKVVRIIGREYFHRLETASDESSSEPERGG